MRRTTARTATVLLGLTLTALPAASAMSAPSASAAETCHGETATLVGTGATLTGTEGRDVLVTGTATTIAALGGDDLICVSPMNGAAPSVLTIDAGDGDDEVAVEDTAVIATGSSIETGAGHDHLVAGQADGLSAVNLSIDRWLLDDRTATVTGMEDVTLMASTARILGDDEDNTFVATACSAKLDGNAGDDTIIHRSDLYFERYDFDCEPRSRIHGDAGSDVLRDASGAGTLHGGPGRDVVRGRGGDDSLDGGSGADVLIGGKGRDQADGRAGRDRCVAERERSCER